MSFVCWLLQNSVGKMESSHQDNWISREGVTRARKCTILWLCERSVCIGLQSSFVVLSRLSWVSISILEGHAHLSTLGVSLITLLQGAFHCISNSSLLRYYVRKEDEVPGGQEAWEMLVRNETLCRDLLLTNNSLTVKEMTSAIHVCVDTTITDRIWWWPNKQRLQHHTWN